MVIVTNILQNIYLRVCKRYMYMYHLKIATNSLLILSVVSISK